MAVVILGIGTAVPQHAIAQAEAAQLAKVFYPPNHDQADRLPRLYGRTGVQTRGSILLEKADGSEVRQSFFQPASGEHDRGPSTQERMERYALEAVPLVVEAADRALTESSLVSRQISQLITVSCTGFAAPGVDIALIKRLGLPLTVGRTHVGFMGCHGALNALRVASALVQVEPTARALVCAVELCSLHFRYGGDAGAVVANALFADGAAVLAIGSVAQVPRHVWQVVAMGSCVFPDCEDAMTWRIGNHGFEMTLSARVPALLAAHLRPWLEHWLSAQGLRLRQVRSWAIHPGGPRLLSTVASSLGLSGEAVAVSRQVLAEHGNMSSSTTLFILERLKRTQAPRPCVALGFGPGLVVETALFA